MKNNNPVLSAVIPVYNEAANIEWFYEELTTLFKQIGEPYELVYVNDGSKDKTDEKVSAIASRDEHVQYICLARNFGKEAATTAGIKYARGNAVILLDGDGQHPSEKIPEMIALWRQGFQHVVGIRTSNEKAGLVKRLGSKFFYATSRSLGANDVVANATDFRLLDRELVDTFNAYSEKRRMTRALLDWSGYKTTYFTFSARERTHGVATYKFSSLVKLAVNGYISSTLRPLYFIGALGGLITVLSSLLLIALLINEVVFFDSLRLGVSGTAYIAIFVTLLVGLVMISQGIIAAYIANIHLESQNRPLYIVNKSHSQIKS